MNKKDRRLMDLGHAFAAEAHKYLGQKCPGASEDPVSLGAFLGSATSDLLSTAFSAIYEMTGDVKVTQDWLTSILSDSAGKIELLIGLKLRIAMTVKAESQGTAHRA